MSLITNLLYYTHTTVVGRPLTITGYLRYLANLVKCSADDEDDLSMITSSTPPLVSLWSSPRAERLLHNSREVDVLTGVPVTRN